MQQIRTFIRKFVFLIINALINLRPFMALFNYVFERAPYGIVVYLTRHVRIPNKDYMWTIVLYNGHKVKTKIYKDNPKTWQFALTYKWHDRAINLLEAVLMEYYPVNTLWIDGGANLGLRSLMALSRKMKVYMIEPNKETDALNEERCRINNFSNYEILPYGISNIDAVKEFYIDKSSYLSSLNKEVIDESKISDKVTITVKKLDTLFAGQFQSKLNAFIKIDIEGHETQALEGAEDLINTLSPTFLIEINTKGEHIRHIFKTMREKAYTIYATQAPEGNSGFLQKCPSDLSGYNFPSQDYLFVKDKELITLLDKHSA